MRIINFKKKKLKLLTKELHNRIKMQKIVIFVKGKLKIKMIKIKKKCKVRDYGHYTEEYRGAAHNISNLKYSIPKKISKVFHD